MPSFFSSGPVERPGAARSTTNAVKCSPSTFAKTVKTSAKPALVMNCFVPVSRYPPFGSRSARVFAASASLPEPGSVSA
jgi:hypothetical protein